MAALQGNNDIPVRVATAVAAQDLFSEVSHATTRAVAPPPPEKSIVDSVVREKVFPKVKFLEKDDVRLAYDEKRGICKTILAGCNVGPHIDKQRFWNATRGWVQKRLSNIRNDVNSQIKHRFWRK